MSKTALAMMSSIAALPAALLAFFVVRTFLNRFGDLSTTFQALAGSLLALCTAIAVLPVLIVLFGPKGEKKAKKPKVADKDSEEDAPADDDVEAVDEGEDPFEVSDEEESSRESGGDDFAIADDELESMDDDDFGEVALDESAFLEDADDSIDPFDEDVFEDEEPK